MRIAPILFFIFPVVCIYGQQPDSLGFGDEKLLNKQEYTILNADFADNKIHFDFRSKKIAYAGGIRGRNFYAKKEFFNTFVRPRIGTDKKRNYFLTILTANEKEISGGYDAFILTPVKMFTADDRKRLVMELSKR